MTSRIHRRRIANGGGEHPRARPADSGGPVWHLGSQAGSLQLAAEAKIFEVLPVGIFELDGEGEIRRANPEFDRLVGHRHGERTIACLAAHVDERDRDRFESQWRELTQKNRLLEGEYRFRHEDGSVHWGELRVVPLAGSSGGVEGFLGSVLNIGRRKEIEEQLRKSDERCHLVFDSMPQFVAVFLPDGSAQVNRSWEEYTGLSAQQSQHLGWVAALHPEDRDRATGEWAAFSHACGTRFDEFRLRRASDGAYRWFMGQLTNVRDASGKPALTIATALDIHDKKQLEVTARQTETRLCRLLETAIEGIAIIDARERIEYVNPHGAAMLGYQVDELLGRNVSELVFPEELPEVRRKQAQMRGGGHEAGTRRMRHRDGSLRWVRHSLTSFLDETGALGGVLSMFTDVTEERKTEEKLLRYSDLLKRLSRQLLETQEAERRRLALELHDQIGQTFTAIGAGLAGIRHRLSAQALQVVDECIRATQAAIQDTRNLARELRPPMLDDRGLTETVRWYAERQAERGRFELRLESNFPELSLGPEVRVACFRVIQEALTNIVRHARARRVWLTLNRSAGSLEVSIRDDGVGFDEEAVRHLPVQEGGLGIFGMEERVRLAGGEFRLTSSPGGGTQVWFRVTLDSQEVRVL